jgi:hypothetical protein
MSDEIDPAKIRAMIQAGSLPDHKADAMWGGRGCGNTCPVCGQAVTAADVEMELEFRGPSGGRVDIYHLHGRCHAFWDFERRNFESARKTGVFDHETSGSPEDSAPL